MLNPFKKYIDNVKAMVQNEIELIKLKAYKNISSVVANAYMLVSLLIFLIITLTICTIWLGFFFSEIFESFNAGFGLTAAIYLFLLMLLIIFRKPLLVNPIENLMAKAYREPAAKKRAENAEDALEPEHMEKAKRRKSAKHAETKDMVDEKPARHR